ncbi:MAG: VOC family protein [Acidimicrobiia bacterium]|nr:VOC family protein [Acidimicrobiia bacterium]
MHPHLITRDAAAAIRFYVDGFGATEKYRLDMPDGRIGHAELRIGDFELHLGDEFPEQGFLAPGEGIPPVSLTLIVSDAAAVLDQAVAAGADVERPLAEEFYGALTAVVRDPAGHRWLIQQFIRDMSPAEMQAAMNEGDEG